MPNVRITRYRQLGCAVLDATSGRYVTAHHIENAWNAFASALARLCATCAMDRVVSFETALQPLLLDAPAGMRHGVYQTPAMKTALTGATWMANTVITVVNLAEEIGVGAETVAYRLVRRGPFRTKALVLEGMHRLASRERLFHAPCR